MIKLKNQIIDEYAGINVLPANGQVTMGTKGDASFIGPDAKMKGGVKRSVYKVPKSSIHSEPDERDEDDNVTPAFYDDKEKRAGKKSHVDIGNIPKTSIHNKKFNETAGFPATTPGGGVGDASFIGKNGMYKGNSRKPIFKTPKSSIYYKKGRFPDEADFHNDDNWETDKPGPSTDVSGKRKYVGNKSVPKNSIHYDEIPDEDRHYISTQEQLGMPVSADGTIDGGPRSMDPIAGKKTKKKKFADASKYGYPKQEKQMENLIKENNNEQLLKDIEFDLKHFNPGNHYMKGEVRIDSEYNSVSIDFRDLGNWIDDVQSGQEDYEDNDWRIWAPGEYKKYFTKFQDWASKRPWYNKVKLGLDTSEKDWCYFSVTVVKPGTKIKEEKNMVNLKADVLSQDAYQKAKKLKQFKASDWKFDSKEQIYRKVKGVKNEVKDNFMIAWAEDEKLKKEMEQFHEEKDYDTNIVPKTSIHYGERDTVPGEPKMKFEKIAKAGFVPDELKNVTTQGDWKSNLTKAVMDLTGEAQPKETSLPVPIVPMSDTPEFPFANEQDGSMSYPFPDGGGSAVKKNGEWTFGNTPQLPALSQQDGEGCGLGHGEPSNGEIDIPCTQKPMIKKLMMMIQHEQKNLHEGVALKGIYEGKVVKLNTIFEGDHRRFKAFVKTNEGKVMKVHFGPKPTEECGMTKKKKAIKEYDSYDRAQYEPKNEKKTYSFLDMISFGEFCQKNNGNVADLLPVWEK